MQEKSFVPCRAAQQVCELPCDESFPTLAGSRQSSTTESAISRGATCETSVSLMIINFYIRNVKRV